MYGAEFPDDIAQSDLRNLRRIEELRSNRNQLDVEDARRQKRMSSTTADPQLRGWAPRRPRNNPERGVRALSKKEKGQVFRSMRKTDIFRSLSTRQREVLSSLWWDYAGPLEIRDGGSLALRDCYPRINTIAGELSCSPKTVWSALNALKRSGLVAWQRTGRASRFVIFPPPDCHPTQTREGPRTRNGR